MRRLVIAVSLALLFAPTPSRAAGGLVIPPGQEEVIQAFLAPVGFSQPVAETWSLQNIAIERERVNLSFVQIADPSVTAGLSIFHPDSGVKGTKMGPVVVVGKAPKEIMAALKDALGSKSKTDLFWEAPVYSGNSPDDVNVGSKKSGSRVLLGLGAGTLLALLIFFEMRTRRRKKPSTDDGSSSADDDPAGVNTNDVSARAAEETGGSKGDDDQNSVEDDTRFSGS